MGIVAPRPGAASESGKITGGWASATGASAASFRSLSENSPYAIVVHDRGRVVFANAAAVNLTLAGSPDQMVE